jgi:hypothetical protein
MKRTILSTVAVVSLLGPFVAGAATYTYDTSTSNPMSNGTQPDFMTLMFTIPFVLAPNAVYAIAVQPRSNRYVSSWSATDSLFGLDVTGVNQTIVRVPSPGLLAGGALDCGTASCLGGAIATNKFGQITQWNLVADSAENQTDLSFITYNNSFLGSVDAIGSPTFFEENTLNGKTGDWSRTQTRAPEIDPLCAASGLTLLLGGLVVVRGRRKSAPIV